MDNIGEKYLPIGTVVMLKGGSKRLMITGFCTTDVENPNLIYDYAGCLYPEGFLSSDQTALFNHDQIIQVYHVGLIDEEENKFKAQLKQVAAKLIMPQVPTTSDNATKNISIANTSSSDETTNSVTPETSETTTISNIKFDENGVVVSS